MVVCLGSVYSAPGSHNCEALCGPEPARKDGRRDHVLRQGGVLDRGEVFDFLFWCSSMLIELDKNPVPLKNRAWTSNTAAVWPSCLLETIRATHFAPQANRSAESVAEGLKR